MVDANYFRVWVIDGEESIKKYCEEKNQRAWNMQIRIKIESISVMALATSVVCIFNCLQNNEDQLIASQNNQVLDYPFNGKPSRNPDASNISLHIHDIVVDDLSHFELYIYRYAISSSA